MQHLGSPMKDSFKLKDGLFEYSKNFLDGAERDTALQWVAQNMPPLDDDLREFMKLGDSEKPQQG